MARRLLENDLYLYSLVGDYEVDIPTTSFTVLSPTRVAVVVTHTLSRQLVDVVLANNSWTRVVPTSVVFNPLSGGSYSVVIQVDKTVDFDPSPGTWHCRLS